MVEIGKLKMILLAYGLVISLNETSSEEIMHRKRQQMNYFRQDLDHVIILLLTKAKANLLINRKYYIEVTKSKNNIENKFIPQMVWRPQKRRSCGRKR